MRTLNLSEIMRVIFFISCVAMPIAMSAQSTFAVLANFYGNGGANPYDGLIQATDGNFYGTTGYGGTNNHGIVFKITPGGKLTTLHSFDFNDGYEPTAPLVEARSGNFYGTTLGGGANGKGTPFTVCPTGFETTPYSMLTSCDSSVRTGLCTYGDFCDSTFSGLA